MPITNSCEGEGFEAVRPPGRLAAASGELALFRHRSVQPSRRAVLHVRAAADPAVPADVVAWFIQRGFQFYLACLRLGQPGRHSLPMPRGGRQMRSALADLDAACTHLRAVDGLAHVIVTAYGQAAIAAARWADRRVRSARRGAQQAGADALILYSPAPAGPGRPLNIACPVLVLTEAAGASVRSRPLRVHRRRSPTAATRLSGHVTWLQLPCSSGLAHLDDDAGRRAFFDELGRWLGAYMYGQLRDQLM